MQSPSSGVEGFSSTTCIRHSSTFQIEAMYPSIPQILKAKMSLEIGERITWYVWKARNKMLILRHGRTASLGPVAARISL